MIRILAILAESVLLGVSCVLVGRRLVHYFQLESYQLPGYFRSVRRNAAASVLPGVIACAAGLAAAFVTGHALIGAAVILAVSAGFYFRMKGEKAKKKFVVTERIKRFLAIHAGVGALLALAANAVHPVLPLLIVAFEPAVLALSACCAQPVEKKINQQFVDDAKARLESMPDLTKIGITGSYGKTSTKFLLRDILSVKYRVLATPSSFNTTMGVTRVIREQLTGQYDVFIAEMGARHVGDIAELVDLVHPTIGLLTSVGEQHLDTFGSIETVRDTKYELIAGLPESGTAILAKDGAHCDTLYERCPLARKYRPGDLIAASDIEAGPWGTRFTLTDTASGETVVCTTRLLGEHSISNLLLCCTAAKTMGMSLSEIAMGVARCRPVEHRLQLLSGGEGIAIIDDAFNSNPVGAAAALRVLKGFPGRRIVVTPGMVELGEREAALNHDFGVQMAESVDEAFLVGIKHTRPIAEGLREAGFPEEKIHVCANLDESTALLRPMMRAGDTILYENDLPDNYTE